MAITTTGWITQDAGVRWGFVPSASAYAGLLGMMVEWFCRVNWMRCAHTGSGKFSVPDPYSGANRRQAILIRLAEMGSEADRLSTRSERSSPRSRPSAINCAFRKPGIGPISLLQ